MWLQSGAQGLRLEGSFALMLWSSIRSTQKAECACACECLYTEQGVRVTRMCFGSCSPGRSDFLLFS